MKPLFLSVMLFYIFCGILQCYCARDDRLLLNYAYLIFVSGIDREILTGHILCFLGILCFVYSIHQACCQRLKKQHCNNKNVLHHLALSLSSYILPLMAIASDKAETAWGEIIYIISCPKVRFGQVSSSREILQNTVALLLSPSP